MMEMQQLLAGMIELNERARVAEARPTDAEQQAQATQQELARSQQAGAKGMGASCDCTAAGATDRRVRVEAPASAVRR